MKGVVLCVGNGQGMEKRLRQHLGIHHVNVNYPNCTATVHFDESVTSLSDIKALAVVLMKNNPLDGLKASTISRPTLRKMKENLFWAVAYNMKVRLKTLIIGVIFLMLGLPWTGESATVNVPSVRYQILSKESTVTFQADSTVGAFSGSTDQVSGEITSTITAWEQETFPPVEATVTIDAKTLDTGIRLRNKDMQGVMEVGKYPQIMYRLETVKQTARHPAEGRFVYDTVGKLQIHGITRTIYMIVEVRRQETEIRIAGETHLRMSGFGISPPSRFFLIRVKDTVTMQFQLVGRQVSQ